MDRYITKLQRYTADCCKFPKDFIMCHCLSVLWYTL